MPNSTTQLKFLIPNSLTYASNVITAVLDSGTRQITLSGLTAGTLYFLYLRAVSGTPTLFAVTTTPQSYRAANPGAVLIGAFYAASATTLASFVTIEGVPESVLTSYSPAISGFGTITNSSVFWKRNGEFLEVPGRFTSGTPAGTPAIIPLPTPLVGDGTKFTQQLSLLGEFQVAGAGVWNPGAASVGWMFANSSSPVDLNVATTSSGTALTVANGNTLISSGQNFNFKFRIPIVGWSNTPLKDL